MVGVEGLCLYCEICSSIVIGQIDYFDPTFEKDVIFSGCGALIFVIDAQDDYLEVGQHKCHLLYIYFNVCVT